MPFSSSVSDCSNNSFSSYISTPCSSSEMGKMAKAFALKNQWEFDFNWADEEFGDEDFILELNKHYNPKPGYAPTPMPSGGVCIPSYAGNEVAMTLAPVNTPTRRTRNKKSKKHVTFLIPEAEPAVKSVTKLVKTVLEPMEPALELVEPVVETAEPVLKPKEQCIASPEVIQPVVQRQRRNKDKRNKRIKKRFAAKQHSARGIDVIIPEVPAPSSTPLVPSSTSLMTSPTSLALIPFKPFFVFEVVITEVPAPSSTSLALIPFQPFDVFAVCAPTKVTKAFIDSPPAEQRTLLEMVLGLMFFFSRLSTQVASRPRILQPTRLAPIISRHARRFFSPFKSCVQIVTSALDASFDSLAKSGSLTSPPLESVPLAAFSVLDISIQAFA